MAKRSRSLPAGRRPALPVTARGRASVSIQRSESEVTIGLDLASLADPADVFVADAADARRTADGLALLFGKLHPYTGRVASLVEVSFPRRAFVEALWRTIEGDFLNGLRNTVGDRCPTDASIEHKEHADADFVSVRANMARVSYASDEAAVDFYLCSTHDVALLLRGGRQDDLDVVSVLRVVLSTPLLAWVLLECERYVAQERLGK